MVEMSKKCVKKGESGQTSKYTISPMRKKHQNTRFQTTTGPQHGDNKWGEMGVTGGRLEKSLPGAHSALTYSLKRLERLQSQLRNYTLQIGCL